jgi:hypothetical protein
MTTVFDMLLSVASSRGQRERIVEANSILQHALAGMAILAGTFIFIVLIHFD